MPKVNDILPASTVVASEGGESRSETATKEKNATKNCADGEELS